MQYADDLGAGGCDGNESEHSDRNPRRTGARQEVMVLVYLRAGKNVHEVL